MHFGKVSDDMLGYAIYCKNVSSRPLWDLFCTEFWVDSESGLHIDLRGRTPEHILSLFWSFLSHKSQLNLASNKNPLVFQAFDTKIVRLSYLYRWLKIKTNTFSASNISVGVGNIFNELLCKNFPSLWQFINFFVKTLVTSLRHVNK